MTRFGFLALLFMWCFAGCRTAGPKSSDTSSVSNQPGTTRSLVALSPQTTLPAAFPRDAIAKENERNLVIPPMMLSVAFVARPRAEVRLGPGGQYELIDLVLPEHAKVLVVDEIGVWRKVIVRDTWQKGWVHYQALSTPVSSSKPLTMSSSLFGTVVTIKAIDRVFDFRNRNHALRVTIPKGTIFRSLRQDEFGSLVWITSTNSVMWLARNDIQ